MTNSKYIVMKPVLATNTLTLIEQRLQIDQGARFKGLQREAFAGLTDAFDTEEPSHRSHLGASSIGRKCSRELWYSFRWVAAPRHAGQLLRLFNRGHLEEGRFLALLKLCDMQVWSLGNDGNQIRFRNGHFAGGCDAVVIGVPDVPVGKAVLSEFKTHGDKSFQKLVTVGLILSKFEHYVQMQIYMDKLNLDYGLYLAVNKNTDELYGEIIVRDSKVAEHYSNRAQDIIASPVPPPKINNSPSWYECKFCDHNLICHYGKQTERNCRTCVNSYPEPSGEWLCKHTGELLTKEAQLKGCSDYRRLV